MEYKGIVNNRDDQRDWLEDLYAKITVPQNQERIATAAAKIAKFADFVCQNCGAPYTKDYVVNQLRGICASCGSDDLHKVSNVEEKKDEKKYECTGCTNVFARSSLKKGFKCTCGSVRFVSQELLEQVSANTREYLTYTGVKVDDIWHEKGKVFASLSGPDWKTSVVSSGNFTKDDVIMFTINQDGGYATVATAQNDPIFKFAKNDKCETRWETSDRIGQEASQILSDLTDIDGNAIKVGNRLEWYLKSGPMRGEVVKASEDGKILVGMTYDEYGPSHQGAYGSVVELTQNEINGLNIKAY